MIKTYIIALDVMFSVDHRYGSHWSRILSIQCAGTLYQYPATSWFFFLPAPHKVPNAYPVDQNRGRDDNHRVSFGRRGFRRQYDFCFRFFFCFLFTLCIGLSRVDSGTPGGFSNDGGTGGGAGPQQSGGVSLSLSAADVTPAGSPDPSSLTVLQPANNNQNNGTVYAASAPTMLPGFTTHYATTGKSTRP